MLIVEFDRFADLDKLLHNDPSAVEAFVRDGGEGGLAISDANDIAFTAGRRRAVTALFTEGMHGAGAGPYLFHVALWVPQDYREEFLAWYDVEHLPILLEASGWDGCRFVEEAVEDGCLFHALHQLSDRDALESSQRKRSRSTPWFQRLSKNAWFDLGFVRTLYQRVSKATPVPAERR